MRQDRLEIVGTVCGWSARLIARQHPDDLGVLQCTVSDEEEDVASISLNLEQIETLISYLQAHLAKIAG